MIKSTFCVIAVCLMALIITFSISRYKADIYYRSGKGLFGKNLIIASIESLKTAIRYNPLQMEYRNLLNGIYLTMATTGLNENRDSIKKDLPDSLFTRQKTVMWLASAITGAKEVQKLYPGDSYSAYILGHAYHVSDKGMSKDAIKYYKQAIRLQPFMFEYRDKLALLYAQKGDYLEAIRESKEAIKIEPNDAIAHICLAKIFINEEKDAEALAALLEYTQKTPNHRNVSIYELLNHIYFKRGKWDEVLKQSKKLAQIDKENFEAHKHIVMAYYKLGRYDDARKSCNRILELAGAENGKYDGYAEKVLKYLSEMQDKEAGGVPP